MAVGRPTPQTARKHRRAAATESLTSRAADSKAPRASRGSSASRRVSSGSTRWSDSLSTSKETTTTSADRTIGELIATGREHHARDRYGDVTVDEWFRWHGVDPDAAREEQYRIHRLVAGPHGPVREPVTHDAFLHEDAVVVACGLTGQPRLLIENTLAALHTTDGSARIPASPTVSVDTYDVEIELA